jgi:TonB family protein
MKPGMLNNGFRGNTSGNIYNMVFLSAIIHFVLITTVLISVPSSSRHLTFGPVYSVQLVGPDIVSARNSSLMQDILQPSEPASSTVLKKEVSGLSPAPTKKEETSKLNVEKAVSAIKQKDLNQQHEASSTSSKTDTFASVKGKIPQIELNSQKNEYIAIVSSRIKGNWKLPSTLMPKDNIETIIDVKISRNGVLEYIAFEKSSGNRYFDDSALKAVKKSSPFPPFPSFIIDSYIEIGVRFHSAELRQK